MKWVAVLCLICLGVSANAQSVEDQARAALRQLEAAEAQLQSAEKARDRVNALSETVQAFEAGLAALREGMRRATSRKAEISARLEARDVEIGHLLAALLTIQPGTSPQAFLHPDGVAGAARAGMLLAEASPALAREATRLRNDLNAISLIEQLQTDAATRLEAGRDQIQDARLALSQAVAERTDRPRRFATDPEKMRLLLDAAQTIEEFAARIEQIAIADQGWNPPDLIDPDGSLPLPARGVVLRYAGEADAAGITRPGIVMATRPGALLTSPTAATIRYQGPLLDMGNVLILEPRAGLLFIFAGLDIAYGDAGQIIPEGAPLGLMGGLTSEMRNNSGSNESERGGAGRSETLYIEVRQDNAPQNPALWFRTD